MSQYEFDEILQKYLEGKCSPAEEEIVLEWYKTFIGESGISLSAAEKRSLEKRIWSKIALDEPGLKGQRPGIVRMIGRSWFRAAAAACLLLLLGGGYWYFNRSAKSGVQAFNKISIPEGYKVISNQDSIVQSVQLTDGSEVELQPNSTLYYPEKFTGKTRNVYLAGNAFFRIAHDTSKHFMVHTDEGLLAEVLGTSFYVLHDKSNDKVEVIVVTGKVSVYEEKIKDAAKLMALEGKIILTPNQKVTYQSLNSKFVTSLVEEPKPLEQATDAQPLQSFVFEETPLSEALTALEKAYGITIETENEQLRNCHVTGDLRKQKLYDKLDVLCKSTQSSYEIRGTVIYIRGKGCN